MRTLWISLLALWLAHTTSAAGVGMEVDGELEGAVHGKKLTRHERMELAKQEAAKYMELRRAGVDEVSHTKEAAAMRDYQLRKKKRKGLLRRRQADLASILFPGVSPENYMPNEPIWAITDLVHSKKTQVPFEFYDLPGCPKPEGKNWMTSLKQRRNLGVRLQGNELMPAPFPLRVTQHESCKPLCRVSIGSKKVRWMRKLVERQYRIQMSLDQLPVLMRSKELNYAVRGYPVGFKAPPSYTGLEEDEYYLYNHVKFTISYQEDPSLFEGIRITGFDVHPVSIKHELGDGEITAKSVISTCNGPDAEEVNNDPSTYLRLRLGATGEDLEVIYSFEVVWQASELPWADRWDVYLIGSPDDDIHFFAIVNSLMIVLFLTGAIATIMIRTLRQDIAGYNEIHSLEGASALPFRVL
jgi:transmembrane 9 superfamily member 2/4